MEEKEFIPYPEYKLFCYSKKKKPLDKKTVGVFVETSKLKDLFASENSLFTQEDLGSFKEFLFTNGELDIQKVKELSFKMGYEDLNLESIYDANNGNSMDQIEFETFVKNL